MNIHDESPFSCVVLFLNPPRSVGYAGESGETCGVAEAGKSKCQFSSLKRLWQRVAGSRLARGCKQNQRRQPGHEIEPANVKSTKFNGYG